MLSRLFLAVAISTAYLFLANLWNTHDPLVYAALGLILSNQFHNMEERRK